MADASCTDQQFIALWREHQSGAAVAKVLNIDSRPVLKRRRRIEKKYNIVLPVYDATRPQYNTAEVGNKAVIKYQISDGVVLVGSDAHIWGRPWTTMQRAFLHFAATAKPAAIIANGDFFDGARISRWPSIGWEQKPSVSQELEAVQDYLGELEKASPKSKRFWPCGNHDARFESKIASALPEFERVKGVHLKDHFPWWAPCWRVDINDDVIVRHRELGGEHADYRNTQSGGKTIVTGHDHRANVTAYSDYTGIRWGVRCGYMCESPEDGQFVNYLEARAPNWCPAFVVLTFVSGRLLWPELVTKFDDTRVNFRGSLVSV